MTQRLLACMLAAPMGVRLRDPRFFGVLAGACYAFAAPPLGFGALLFVAAVLWLRAVELAAPSANPLTGAKVGLFVGFTGHIIIFYWAVPLFTAHVPIPWPVALLLAALVWFGQALPFAFVGALTETLHAAKIPRSVAMAMATPIGFELVWSMFPWRPAEVAVEVLVYAQMADLSGPALVDAAIVLAGAGLVEGLRTGRRWLVAASVLALVLPVVYGVHRMAEIDALASRAPIVRVGAVQPNVMQTVKFDPRMAPSHLDNLRRLTGEVEAEGVAFSVWPETSYPWPLAREFTSDPVGRHGVHYGGRVRGPVVFGALSIGAGCDHRNSALAMDSEGDIVGIADKVLLLPFSERIPFYDHLPLVKRFFRCPGFASGVGPQLLELEGVRMGILNCYEDLIPWYAREVARERPEFLLNITNDAWFLDTSEPHLHHMAARLRTIETRREMLRVVNTGLTGHIDSNGRRLEELPVWTRGSMVAEIRRLPDGTSDYLVHGDRVTPVLYALVLLAFARLAYLRFSRDL